MYSLLQFVLVPSVLSGCGTVYKCTLNNKEWNSFTQIKDFIREINNKKCIATRRASSVALKSVRSDLSCFNELFLV